MPNTEEIVQNLLAEMQAAAEGGEGAKRRLAGDTEEEEAEATVPSPAGLTCGVKQITRPNGELYIVRKMGDHDDISVIRMARDKRMPLLMYGAPGCGKTAGFEAAFADTGFEYVPGSGDTEVADFIGTYTPLPGGEFAWVDGPLVRAMENGVPLLVDEIALIDPKVMAVVYSVMDGRAELNVTANPDRGIIKSKEGFAVFGACNPNAPGARMSEALLSRFMIHAEVTVDFGLVKKMGVPSKMITAAQNMKRKVETDGAMGWFPAVRELLAFKEVSATFGEDVALRNIISQAPEIDRAQVADVLQRTYGRSVTTLTIA